MLRSSSTRAMVGMNDSPVLATPPTGPRNYDVWSLFQQNTSRMWRNLPFGKARTVTSFSPAAAARALLSVMREGALATLGPDGAPFSSLVAVAPDEAGEPLLLLSRLAVHTRN